MVEADGWTFATLLRHLAGLREADQKAVSIALDAAKEATQAALVAAEKASDRASDAANKRAEMVDEVRGTMADQQRLFSNKAQTDMQFQGVGERLDKIEDAQAAWKGRAGGIGTVAWSLAATIAAIAAIFGMFVSFSGWNAADSRAKQLEAVSQRVEQNSRRLDSVQGNTQ